ncbi:hypothetical protein AC579_7116 [Pseudocercospora musae]|uniref:Uncharacterized protein n=1 Tax=Pseudocercospora musae TaxID=113226 RepID=A0A139IMN6_9PEZI|nr:hypothetical protein AC579_7116 [Pseudocercospora musae]
MTRRSRPSRPKHTRWSDYEEATPSAKSQKREHEHINESIEETSIKNDNKVGAAYPPKEGHSVRDVATRKSQTGSITEKLKHKFKRSESPEKTKARSPRNTKPPSMVLQARYETIHYAISSRADEAGNAEESTNDDNASPRNDDDPDEEGPSRAKAKRNPSEWVVSHGEVGKNYHKTYEHLSKTERKERNAIVKWFQEHINPYVDCTGQLMPIGRMPHKCPLEITGLGMPFLRALKRVWMQEKCDPKKVFHWIEDTARTKYPNRPDARFGSVDINDAADHVHDADLKAETVAKLMGAVGVEHVNEYENDEDGGDDESKRDGKERKAMFRRSAEF